MRKSIDAKGLACPQPVILCRKALAEGGLDEIEVIVDNEAARQNVIRFLKFCGATEPVVASRGSVHAISTSVSEPMAQKARGGEAAPACDDEEAPVSGEKLSGTTLFFSADQIGRGDEALGKILIRGMLYAVSELDRPPATMVLMNSGVRLAAEREDTIELLKKIEARGSRILVCGTCLDYYHLTESLRAGRISNLSEITETFLSPATVVTVS